MGTEKVVSYQVKSHVATITLNRSDAANSFSLQLRDDLFSAVQEANANENIRVVILTGAGRNFSAGADLTEAQPALVQQRLEGEFKPILMAITCAPKPYISAINGAAAGIGSAFAMACDLTMMAENAFIYQVFSTIGLVPDGGTTWHLARQLGRKRAYEIMVTGGKINAQSCLEWGLANRVVAAEKLIEEAQRWAEELAAKAPLALRYTKEALHEAMERDLGEMISYEAMLQNFTSISEDAKEGVKSFFEKREPVFRGK